MQRDATRAGSIQLKISLNIFPCLYSVDKGCCTASIEVEARGNCNAPGAIAMGAGRNREWCPNAKKVSAVKSKDTLLYIICKPNKARAGKKEN